MKRRTVPLLVVVCALLALSACTGKKAPQAAVPRNASEVPTITARELMTRIDQGDRLVIVDVRSQGSYDVSHIPDSIYVPYGQMLSHMDLFPATHDIVFLCTCPNEESSAASALVLHQNGHRGAFALKGGLQAWVDEGYPVARTQ